MDTLQLIALIIVALIVLAAIIAYRRKLKVALKFLGINLDVEAENKARTALWIAASSLPGVSNMFLPAMSGNFSPALTTGFCAKFWPAKLNVRTPYG